MCLKYHFLVQPFPKQTKQTKISNNTLGRCPVLEVCPLVMAVETWIIDNENDFAQRNSQPLWKQLSKANCFAKRVHPWGPKAGWLCTQFLPNTRGTCARPSWLGPDITALQNSLVFKESVKKKWKKVRKAQPCKTSAPWVLRRHQGLCVNESFSVWQERVILHVLYSDGPILNNTDDGLGKLEKKKWQLVEAKQGTLGDTRKDPFKENFPPCLNLIVQSNEDTRSSGFGIGLKASVKIELFMPDLHPVKYQLWNKKLFS